MLADLVKHAKRTLRFRGSGHYWEQRYKQGRGSGKGSRAAAADFKAEHINRFVEQHALGSVIEFGCGDGQQLSLAHYPRYVGVDVSPTVVDLCRRKFADDETKQFMTLDEYANSHSNNNSHSNGNGAGATAEVALSLDVIYHLVEDEVYEAYMQTLFNAAQKFVIIYSSNFDKERKRLSREPHVRHRRFTDWIDRERAEWRLLETTAANASGHSNNNSHNNGNGDQEPSTISFFIYERSAANGGGGQ